MKTVVETPAYLAAAKDAGMTEAERTAAVLTLAANPEAGDLIQGTGGCRKVRVAGRGKGKSGGYRVITYFALGAGRVFLLTVFSKGERSDLSPKEKAALAAVAKTIDR
ncbi:type II toxin-antitoxin system RelE/ParE family toxin [Inquilinus limosus]|uniref:Addiction module toxin RelE n=1 Tax=Inquilinus limosus TaxID=171674 RepID=A0A211ZQD3_9PROT|nr:type II toxin-antitoxin system RelE/ParE family toxin [Inquilinus limosus]OWJ67460.1 addiction module toxin RelE [Inquilinus limosus]